LQKAISEIIEIIEGQTKILVPKKSITEKVPPKEPAFFNPRAKLNRDFSIVAYSAFLKNFEGPKVFLEGLAGIGARGLRVANELDCIDKVIINELNPNALELAQRSSELNNLTNFEISEDEVCRFLISYSQRGKRGTIVDIDPFGSPAKYLDCGIRSTLHGGLLSTTATDLQVLHGLFSKACKRRYGGIPIKTEYSNEIAIRLILGCMRTIAARLDIEIIPLVVQTDQHYYRTYVQILNRPDQKDNLGFILHCRTCGHRESTPIQKNECSLCNSKVEIAGPLWIGNLFDKKFIETMLQQLPNFEVDKKFERVFQKCILESEMPTTYFTLDEIASKIQVSPPKLEKVISKLQKNGFQATPTSFSPTGFRTDAKMDKIIEVFT